MKKLKLKDKNVKCQKCSANVKSTKKTSLKYNNLSLSVSLSITVFIFQACQCHVTVVPYLLHFLLPSSIVDLRHICSYYAV